MRLAKILPLAFAFGLAFGCAHRPTTTGAWFCCPDDGAPCVPATGVCPEGSKLLWCKNPGTDGSGKKICLD